MPICTQCSTTFEISNRDKTFYEELRVSPPTLCPVCRVQRRMAWRNDRSFYKRKCDKTGLEFVSTYAPNTEFPVFHPDVWYGDNWDPMDEAQDFDFTRPFFEQWDELKNKVPRLGIDIINCQNSYYCNFCGDDKNCYLDIAGEGNEDCYFNLFTKYSKDCVDCTFVYNSQLVYESLFCYDCYNVLFSKYLENCSDCLFSFDLKGCKHCMFCTNLRQKEYYIANKPYSKTDYEEKLKQLNLGSRESLQKLQNYWHEVMRKAIHRDMYNLNSENCSGNNIRNSKNCYYCFNISNCEDCKFLYDVLEANDCMDLSYSLYDPEKSVELISTLNLKFSGFCMASHYLSECFYCDQCNYSQNLFGCIGLRHKENCILNKQYQPGDYKNMVAKIIEHMKRTGEWGEFFPPSYSPWGYNETVADEYIPLSKSDAEAKGFNWKERPQTSFKGETIKPPDNIIDIDESLTDKIIKASTGGKPFKIIPQELKFYRKLGLPIPDKSPDERHRQRLALRNPRRLWDRKCDKCGKEVRTSYSPGKPETVYCEACYLAEVY